MSIPPSPWKPAGRAVVAADGTMVALANPTNILVPPQGVPGDFDPEVLALLCAAPVMLAALEAVVSVADRKTVEFDQARAAIAQAKRSRP